MCPVYSVKDQPDHYKDVDREGAICREDLGYFAENGWSLQGLVQILRAQGRMDEANKVQGRFEQA